MKLLNGIGVSQGIGIGKALFFQEGLFDYSTRKYTAAAEEEARLNNAIGALKKEITNSISELNRLARKNEAAIFEGHFAILQDNFLLSQIFNKISNGILPEIAVEEVFTALYAEMIRIKDKSLQQRATDIRDLKERLIRLLSNTRAPEITGSGSILIAQIFTPSTICRLRQGGVAAIIAETGDTSCHSAILARAMKIPAVFSVKNASSLLHSGETLIVDACRGIILPRPSTEEIERYTEKRSVFLKGQAHLHKYLHHPTITKSQEVKHVYGNICTAEEVSSVLQNGGEGIGLFRTEFLFMRGTRAPSEAEQLSTYASTAKAMNGKPVIIRTLDIGGDKRLPYLSTEKEDNPLLGNRGIRFSLEHTDLFKTQLRALLRAAAYGDIKIMLPLISTLEEVKTAKAIIEECKAALLREGLRFGEAPLGIMIETPSAAIISDLLAKEAAFFSVGTNDLIGYTMAADRGNEKVSSLYQICQPSVLRLLKMTIKNAKESGIPVGICGEAAADAHLIPSLLEWGADTFSVSPSSILPTRKVICESAL